MLCIHGGIELAEVVKDRTKKRVSSHAAGSAEPRPLRKRRLRDENARRVERMYVEHAEMKSRAQAAAIENTVRKLESLVGDWEVTFEKTVGALATAAPVLLEGSIEDALAGDRKERQFLLKLIVQLRNKGESRPSSRIAGHDRLQRIAREAASYANQDDS